MEGYIKLHREILKWEWYGDINVSRVFIHMLLRANHAPNKWQGISIKKGQLVTGRFKLSEETGLTQQQIRRVIKILQQSKEITIKPTNKFSVITISNWEKWQGEDKKRTSNSTNKEPAGNQQRTTNKNDKNEKNDIYADFLNTFNKTSKSNKRVVDKKTKGQIDVLQENKYTIQHLEQAIRNAMTDDYLMGKNDKGRKYLTLEYITRSEKFEHWLENKSGVTIKGKVTDKILTFNN